MAPVPDWTCPCCGQRAGTKRLTRRTAPDCLVIQLLRFARGDGTTRKLAYPAMVPVNGLGIETGIDMHKLIAAGDYICGVLGRPTLSRVARAIRAKAA